MTSDSSPSNARRQLQELEALLQSRPPELQRPVDLQKLAEGYLAQKRYWDARKWFLQALTRAQQTGEHTLLGDLHYQMARVLAKQRQWPDAQSHFEQALAEQEQEPQPSQDTRYKTHHQLGRAHQEQGHWAESRQHYEQALSLMQAQGQTRHLGLSFYQLGQVCQAQDEAYAALDAYQKALEHLSPEQYPQQRAEIYYQLGDVLSKLEEPVLAKQSYAAALKNWQAIQNKTWEGMSWLKLALLALSQGQVQEVLDTVPEAIVCLEQTREYAALKMAYELLAELKELHSEMAAGRELREKANRAEKQRLKEEARRRRSGSA